ncbi:putative PAS/PAC sensor hybrid histidine kinase [Magnetofaba australis IT-1]|uniref:histidine kinase n=1 Tax=Magnetofaba australis IT-1 TaxID=1434232 RepID=A0A1Y2K514_9PROT|nr:putative PAS/PAC sensor hybrid histidine kinase [Magnetofaba australis IT-1]
MAISLAIGAVMTLGYLLWDMQWERHHIVAEQTRLLRIQSQSQFDAFDHPLTPQSAIEFTQQLLHANPVTMVTLRDANGKPLAYAERSPKESFTAQVSAWMLGDSADLETLLHVAGAPGPWRLQWMLDAPLAAQIYWRRALLTVLLGFGGSLLLGLLLLRVVQRNISTPLNQIVAHLLRISPDQLDACRLETPVNHERDELGVLAKILDELLVSSGQTLMRSKRAEERLLGVIKALPDVVLILDAHGGCLEVLSSDEPTRRAYAAQIANRQFDRVTVEGVEEEFEHAIARTLATNSLQIVEFHLAVEEGGRIFEGRMTPLGKHPEIHEPSVILVARDITHRKRVEERLRDQLHFQNVLMDNIPNPLFYKDIRGRYLGCNNAFEGILGISEQNLIGKNVHDLLDVDTATKYEQADMDLFQRGGEQRYEGRLTYADGASHDVIFNKRAFYTADGKIGGLVGVIQDITMRKNMEGQLRQALKMEAIGALAGGIAHDFNNILSAILGFTELSLSEVEPDSLIHRNLTQVYTAGGRARDLVKQLLDFSRPSDEGMSPQNPSTVVRESVKLLRATLPSTIRIETRVDEQDGMVRADPTQLQQVMMNLCTNGARAMRETGGVLSISLENRILPDPPSGLPPGSYFVLSVSDTGVGIPQSHLEHIFDPFFTTSKVGEGSGLGLSVVHGIINKHGGAVTVESQEGSGSTFSVYLPRAELTAEEGQAQNNLPSPASPLAPSRSRRSARILLVDDELEVLDAAQGQLQRAGFQVEAFSSPVEAWRAFEQNPQRFDLLITDQTMPGLTGLQLVERVRSLRNDLPIALCTGYSELAGPDEAREMGVGSYLMKPILGREMVETADALLDRTASPPPRKDETDPQPADGT